METIETIIQWHKETFPDTTLEEQEKKFLIEFDEYIEAIGKDEQTKELADMQIVAYGIARFNRERSQVLTDKVLKYAEKFKHNLDDLNEAIQEKMAINRKRKWQYANGEWRHKNDDINN